jgi:glycosyltransferase involved in cell wall biosynthesis
MTLRVLIDRGNAPPRTGIGIYADGVLRACERYLKEKVVVSEAGVSWVGSSMRPVRRLVYFARLAHLRRKKYLDADVVHFMNVYTPPPVRGTGYVGTITDLDTILFPEAHTKRYLLYFRRTAKKTLERANIVVVISEAVRKDVGEYFDGRVDNVRVAGIGLSDAFMALADAIQRSYPQTPTLLYVGKVDKKKNSAWLVRTFANGLRNGALPRMKLIIAGSPGFGFAEVKSALRDAGDSVQWISSPSLEELVRLYSMCSAFVFPSVREGFGIPLLEAMYVGKPIVASRIPASVEIAGGAAYFFDLGSEEGFFECVRRSVFDDINTDQAREVKKVLERYSWSNLSKRYLDIYEEARERRTA